MEDAQWKRSLSENMARLRREKGFTQAELGEKLNYSDKSISKWERGEGAPDVGVLVRLAELYGVSLDALLGREAREIVPAPCANSSARDRALLLITLESGVWLLSLLAFGALWFILPDMNRKWLAFIYALPVSFGCLGACFVKWKLTPWAFGAFSIVMWTLCVALQLSFPGFSGAMIYVGGSALQMAALLIGGVRARGKGGR